MRVINDRGGWLRRPPAPPWALAALTAMVGIVALSYQELTAWVWAGALLAPVAAVALLPAYPLISLAVCAATSMATAAAMDDAVPVWSAALSAALFMISFLAGRRMPRPAPALAVFAAAAVLDIPLGLMVAGVWATAPLLLGVTVVLPWLLGRTVRQQTELVAAAAEHAQLRERARIAYDMHDTLGHELALLALRAGALELAPDLSDKHRTAAAELRASAGLATERLAEVVTVLRDGAPAPLRPDSDRIEDLVERAAQAGAAVSLEWHGPRQVPPMVDRTAHRMVQEALTNATKHAPGAAVRVTVVTTDTATSITVTNALPAPAPRRADGGLGLVGLRERVRLAGGTLRAGARDHTFELTATLPHRNAP